MKQDRRRCAAFVMSVEILLCAKPGLAQTKHPDAASVIQQIMSTALQRCYSTVNGIKRISVVPPTDQEFAEVKNLDQDAVAPLTEYLDLKPKNGIT